MTILASLRSLVGADELLLLVALVLLVVGLWPWLGRGALVPVGLFLLWLGCPSRAPFITPTTTADPDPAHGHHVGSRRAMTGGK